MPISAGSEGPASVFHPQPSALEPGWEFRGRGDVRGTIAGGAYKCSWS